MKEAFLLLDGVSFTDQARVHIDSARLGLAAC
jgi:hypothetical protein